MFINQFEAEQITTYLDITASCDKADLLFVFGNSLEQPALIAAEVILANRVKWVVLTGGVHKIEGFNEAERHLDILLSCGVTRERIVVENESRNTRENVLFALPQMMKQLALDDIKSIVVVAMWQHCRRATMTLKRHLPIGTRYSNLIYEYGYATREDWQHNEEGYAQVMDNYQSIQEYLKRDHIAEIQKDNDAYV